LALAEVPEFMRMDFKPMRRETRSFQAMEYAMNDPNGDRGD